MSSRSLDGKLSIGSSCASQTAPSLFSSSPPRPIARNSRKPTCFNRRAPWRSAVWPLYPDGKRLRWRSRRQGLFAIFGLYGILPIALAPEGQLGNHERLALPYSSSRQRLGLGLPRPLAGDARDTPTATSKRFGPPRHADLEVAGARGYENEMRLTSSCYAVPGLCCFPPWSHNAGFVVGASRTLVVDTGGNVAAAQTIHGYATAVRSGQPLLAVNTEPHLDHLLGNAFFAERGVEIFGHAAIARTEADFAAYREEVRACIPERMRRERQEERAFFAGTVLQNPTRPIVEDIEIDLGGLVARLILTPGHTPSNLCVYVPAEKVLYAADCLEPDYVPSLNGGPEDWRSWLASLDRIDALGAEVAVPGHGRVLVTASEVHGEVERVREVLHEALRTGKAPTAD